MKMLVPAGDRCEKLMGWFIVNIPVSDVQCDEIWGFVRKKELHKSPDEAHDNSIGDAYCFVALERHSKLVLNFALGRRDQATTDIFVEPARCNLADLVVSTQHGRISAVQIRNYDHIAGSL
jgi:hypothetical protein